MDAKPPGHPRSRFERLKWPAAGPARLEPSIDTVGVEFPRWAEGRNAGGTVRPDAFRHERAAGWFNTLLSVDRERGVLQRWAAPIACCWKNTCRSGATLTRIRGFSGCCFELIAGLKIELGLERVDLVGGDGRDDVNEGVDDGSMLGQIEGGELLDMADVVSAMFRAFSKTLSCKDMGSDFMFLRTRVNSVSPRRNRSSASFWPI